MARPWQAPKPMGELYLPNEPKLEVCKVKATRDKEGDERKAYWPNEPKLRITPWLTKGNAGVGQR